MANNRAAFSVENEHVLSPEAKLAEENLQVAITGLAMDEIDNLYPDCKKMLDYLQNKEKPGTSFFHRKLNLKTAMTLSDFLNAASSLDQKITRILQTNDLLDPYAHAMLYSAVFRTLYTAVGPYYLTKPTENEANLVIRIKSLLNDVVSAENMDRLMLSQPKKVKESYSDELSDHMVVCVSQLASTLEKLHPAIGQMSAEDSQLLEADLPAVDKKSRANIQQLNQYLTVKNTAYVNEQKSLSSITDVLEVSIIVDMAGLRNLQGLINLYNYHQYVLSHTVPTNDQLLISLKYLSDIAEKVAGSYDLPESTEKQLQDQIKSHMQALTNLFDEKSREASVTLTRGSSNSSSDNSPSVSSSGSRRPSQ
ncbi:MAG: hypothetical protein P4M14_06080 [Gammaproteobacteria bacterium]|nr:hypothetical protein [Gammaproteobacteria bacterium]